jgi:4-hydroxyproline epimerase
MKQIQVIDSHTEGEPTRVVIAGGPDLGAGTAGDRLANFKRHHDDFRGLIAQEPRGSEAMVGALLQEPTNSNAVAQVIFFNNVGTLNMCVHGTIGVAATLLHLGKIESGTHLFETPAGDVTVACLSDGLITVENVSSYRFAADVSCSTESHGTVTGDIAWGGNWFYLVSDHGRSIEPASIDALTEFAWDIKQSLAKAGITGEAGAEIA